MFVSCVRIFAPLLLLAGIPGSAHAGLPACESDLGVLVPGIGGTGCSVELFVRPGPHATRSFSLTKLPLPRSESEYAFDVILDRRQLEMPNPTDWFRVLTVRAKVPSDQARFWAIDVNGRRNTGAGMRLVEYKSDSEFGSTIVSSISLDSSIPCPRIEAIWTRAPFSGGQSTLAWHVSNPSSCDQPDTYAVSVRTIVFGNVGELQAAEIGSLDLFATGIADGKVTAHLIEY